MEFNSAFKGLNGLVRFAERRNLVSARVPSHFKLSLYLSTPPKLPQSVYKFYPSRERGNNEGMLLTLSVMTVR